MRSRILIGITLALAAGLIGWMVTAVVKGRNQNGADLESIRVPAGFKVEKVAGSDLVGYPMMGTLDDRGRLFLCESSGNTLTTQQMAAKPDYRIRLLEDTDGDGVFDRSQIFAENLTLPAGAVWHRGSLYVASPPDVLRFDDTNHDGVADHREAIVTGWNLSANAASLHGPIMGPDGWLYLTDGRHGYKIQTKEGPVLEGKASRIWRLRPDGTGLEWVSGGGFDNPVEVVFTPEGEMIGTMTYFTDPANGERDALLHFVEGGVYPKWYSVVSEFKRTGDLMPVMTKFARIAPAGLVRYRNGSFGAEYEGNLFSAQFNPHRVQRHKVFREGATFRTEDEDFLTSSNPDFHPTDVMEDADGSLLVVDTGAWFIHGCPISRISKPEIKGAIYRVRRTTASPKVEDPRGSRLKLDQMPPQELVKQLTDARFAVRDRGLDLLVEAGEAAVAPLNDLRKTPQQPEVRAAAVFGLSRIGTPGARQAIRAALEDSDSMVRVAAARSAGMAKDEAALNRLMDMVQKDEPPARRQAATALGQIGDKRAAAALLAAASRADDRFIEHAIIYSLIQLGDSRAAIAGLKDSQPRIRKAALIALDQMEASPLRGRQAASFLKEEDKDLRTAALWVISHHPDWSGEVLNFLRARLETREWAAGEAESVADVLVSFCADKAVQGIIADSLGASSRPERQLFLLETIDRCSLNEVPPAWLQALGSLLDGSDTNLRMRAAALIRSRGIDTLDEKLQRIAANQAEPDDLRTMALGILVLRHPKLDHSSVKFLLGRLSPDTEATVRLSAAQVLGRAQLTAPDLLVLAQRHFARTDALIQPILLDAFRHSDSEEVGRALISVLLNSPASVATAGKDRLKTVLQHYPEKVQKASVPLFARLEEAQKTRIQRLQKLEPLLTAGGDVGHGRRIFFGEKVACSSCHTIGREGGHVGPDLTGIGAIRSGHDLLEAIVFPSASFVPGHEVFNVDTAEGRISGVVGSRTADFVVLICGPNDIVRIPRKKILSMKPSDVSLMPEGFDESLTRAELTDLLAFLQSEGTSHVAQNRRR